MHLSRLFFIETAVSFSFLSRSPESRELQNPGFVFPTPVSRCIHSSVPLCTSYCCLQSTHQYLCGKLRLSLVIRCSLFSLRSLQNYLRQGANNWPTDQRHSHLPYSSSTSKHRQAVFAHHPAYPCFCNQHTGTCPVAVRKTKDERQKQEIQEEALQQLAVPRASGVYGTPE